MAEQNKSENFSDPMPLSSDTIRGFVMGADGINSTVVEGADGQAYVLGRGYRAPVIQGPEMLARLKGGKLGSIDGGVSISRGNGDAAWTRPVGLPEGSQLNDDEAFGEYGKRLNAAVDDWFENTTVDERRAFYKRFDLKRSVALGAKDE